MADSKTCNACGMDLPLTAFNLQKKGKFGRQSRCRTCISKLYYEPNKAAVIERTRQRRSTEQGRENERQWQRQRRRSNPIRRMLQEAKVRASKKAIGFAITEADIEIPEKCPVLGIELTMGAGVRADCSPSIDRVNSAIGYVPGNVRVISWRANRLKNDATLAELRAITAYMESALDAAVTAAHQLQQGKP